MDKKDRLEELKELMASSSTVLSDLNHQAYEAEDEENETEIEKISVLRDQAEAIFNAYQAEFNKIYEELYMTDKNIASWRNAFGAEQECFYAR